MALLTTLTRTEALALRSGNGTITVMVGAFPKQVKIADLAPALPHVIDVVDDTAKLALTSILVGQIVRVTGSSNRLEIYNGGTISSAGSWKILNGT